MVKIAKTALVILAYTICTLKYYIKEVLIHVNVSTGNKTLANK